MTKPIAVRRRGLPAPTVVLILLCVMYGITYIDRVNVGTAASAIKAELGLSNTELGLVFSAFAYPYALLQIGGGWVSDRLGPRVTLTVCGLLWAVATILTGFAGGLVSLFLARVLLGLGEGATFPGATRAMQSWVSREARGFAQGITHACARLGNAITPPLVAWLTLALTWRGSFVVLGCVSLVWIAVWAWYYRDDPARHPAITAADLAVLPPRRDAEKPRVPWGPLVRRMMPVTVTYFCYGWTLWLYLNWLPSFFLHEYKLDLKHSAIFSSGVFFAGVIGDTFGGLLTDAVYRRTGSLKRARRDVVVLGFVGSLAFLIPVLFTRDLTLMAGCLSGAFFFAEVVIGPMWAIPMDRAALLGHRGGDHEHRQRGRGDRLAAGLRSHHRRDGQLGAAVPRLDRSAGARPVPGVHHASGARVRARRERGAAADMKRLMLAAALLTAAPPAWAASPSWPGDFVGRLEALAILQTLNADLLSHPSATATLEHWCAEHRLAAVPRLSAELVREEKPLPEADRGLLQLGPSEAVTYRRVRLTCGDVVLSEADNWYVPSRLTPEMNRLLEQTDTPFGRAVAALHFTRQTLSAELLWHPLPEGWETGPIIAGRAEPVLVPDVVLRHRAVLFTSEHVPFSEVVESYTSGVLAFPPPAVETH